MKWRQQMEEQAVLSSPLSSESRSQGSFLSPGWKPQVSNKERLTKAAEVGPLKKSCCRLNVCHVFLIFMCRLLIDSLFRYHFCLNYCISFSASLVDTFIRNSTKASDGRSLLLGQIE